MTEEVLQRKLNLMSTYLEDLKQYKDLSFHDYMRFHYAIERIIELIVVTASDLILHLLKEKDESAPTSYSASFLRAGEIGLISMSLSQRLSQSAGLRNILVHQYEKVDDQIVYASVNRAWKDYRQFVKEMSDVDYMK